MNRRERRIITNTQIFREPDRQKYRELLIVIGVIFILLIPFLIYIWEGIEMVRIGYKTEELKALKSELVEENRVLEIKKAKLLSVGRMERLARKKLNLQYPKPGQVVFVNVSGLKMDSCATGDEPEHRGGEAK